MNGHLRLDLKALGKHRKSLDKPVAESPISCHDVLDVCMEKMIDAPADQAVSQIMKRPFVFLKIGGGKTVPHDHIHPLLKHEVAHFPGVLGRIGIIPVHHNIAFRVDLGKHSSDDVSLPLLMFPADRAAQFLRDCPAAVRGIVIVYINPCFRMLRKPSRIR